MNAEMNVVSERTSHPLAMNSESPQVLAHWLKSKGTRQISDIDPRRIMIERYPVGLFSEAELEALWDVIEG
jgi:carbamoylphosphate synthase small subunit